MTPRAVTSSGTSARASSSQSSSCCETIPDPSCGMELPAVKVEASGRTIVMMSSVPADRAMEIARAMASRPRSVAMYPTTSRRAVAGACDIVFSQ